MNDNICKYLYMFFFVITRFQCQQASSSLSCHASVFTPGILFLISHSSWRISAVIIVWHFTNANRKWVSSRNAEGWEVSGRWTVWLFCEISNSSSELKWEEKQHFIVIKSGFGLRSQKAHAPRLPAPVHAWAMAPLWISVSFSVKWECSILQGFRGSLMKGCMQSVQSQAWHMARTP